MIHANELMTGDWVLINGNPMQVQAIDGIDDEIMAGDDLYCCLAEDRVHSEDKCEPIPITPEILEKNGLTPDTVEDAYKYCYKKDEVSIVECYANAGGRFRGIFTFGDTRLRITLMFVHQLQHCLRLVGIEKDITL